MLDSEAQMGLRDTCMGSATAPGKKQTTRYLMNKHWWFKHIRLVASYRLVDKMNNSRLAVILDSLECSQHHVLLGCRHVLHTDALKNRVWIVPAIF